VQKIGGRNSEKTGKRRGMAERRRMPKGFSSPSRDGSRHYHGITMVQKLVKDLLAAFISSFRRGDEPP